GADKPRTRSEVYRNCRGVCRPNCNNASLSDCCDILICTVVSCACACCDVPPSTRAIDRARGVKTMGSMCRAIRMGCGSPLREMWLITNVFLVNVSVARGANPVIHGSDGADYVHGRSLLLSKTSEPHETLNQNIDYFVTVIRF